MAQFKGTLSQPDLKFTQLTPSRRPDARKAVIEGVSQIAQVAGKGAAKSNAADLVGADLTQEEVNDQAQLIDTEIESALATEKEEVAGPLQDTRVNEIKDVQLSEFAKNDRVLLALRDQGTLTTTEIRARRTLNLHRALSNPINALFKGDFLNAVSDLTGGAKGAAKALFPMTIEEERALAVQAAQTKAIAEVEGQIAGVVQATGQPEEVVRRERSAQEYDKEQIRRLERIARGRALSGEEVGQKFASITNNATRGISAQIANFSQETGGRGLNAQSKAVTDRTIEQQFQGMVEALNLERTLGNKERDAQIERLKNWRTGMLEMSKTYDATLFDQAKITELEQIATQHAWQDVAPLMYLKTISPELFKVFVESGGNVNGTFDRIMGEGTGKRISDTSTVLSSLASFANGQPVRDPRAIAGVLGTPEGIDYLNSEEVQGNDAIRLNLRKMYNDASEESLRMYLAPSAIISSRKDVGTRQGISEAMTIVRDKMDNVKKMVGVPEALITASVSQTATRRRGKPNIVLDIPDNMLEFSDELKQMYRVIETHIWSWEHVSEEFLDATDAFNGYLRGEWEFNLNVPDVPERNRRGRVVQQQAPSEETTEE